MENNFEDIYYSKDYQTASRIPLEKLLYIQWIRDLVYISEVLNAQIDTSIYWDTLYVQMFYVKLFGIIDEKQENVVRNFKEDEYIKRVKNAISEIKNKLSNDERIFIEYRRNSAAHPIQNGYDIFAEYGDKIEKPRNMQIDGAKLSLSREDVNKAIGRILERNGNDDIKCDVSIVKKIAPIILQLKEDLVKNYINSMKFF